MLLVENANGVTIQGNGATLKLNNGLRYGSFDPATGKRFDPPDSGRFTPPGYAAIVGRLIEFRDCSDIRVSDLELDGNMDRLELGGRYGDVEIQLPATGLQLTRVSRVLVENVRSHTHGLDGIYLYGRKMIVRSGRGLRRIPA